MRLPPWLPLLLLMMPTTIAQAQALEEPPIPVMIVCPYHEDSLRRAYEAGLMAPPDDQRRHLDSTSLSTIKAAEAMTTRMEHLLTYLSLLVGLLAVTSIAALRSAYRLRLEVQDLKNTRSTPPPALPSSVIVQSTAEPLPRSKAASAKSPLRPAPTSKKRSRPRSSTP